MSTNMNLLFGDFETFYSDDYTLRKVTPAEYINDFRFQALGCAFAWNQQEPFWVDGPDLKGFFAVVDWTTTVFVSHNALFDASILAWRFDIHPIIIGCTLSMSRQWLAHRSKGGSSLDAISATLGFPPKMATVGKMKGKNLAMIQAEPALYDEMRVYAMDDVGKCRAIYKHCIATGYPTEQLYVVDAILKMGTQPAFVADQHVLFEHLADIQAAKARLLAETGLNDPKALMSDNLLATLLINQGVEPPTKASPTNGETRWAFAKGDKEFTDLAEHDDPMVQALVAARLGHKSTLEESRTQRFIDVSRIEWQTRQWPCAMPIALKPGGAHTGRLSGDWKLNQQNLPRATKARPARLRQSLRAPRGKIVISCDASQIEARILATLAGQADLVQAFKEGRDVYAEFASKIFGYTVTKSTHPRERQIGKIAILSLGYGAAAQTYQNMVRVQTGGEVTVSDAEAANIITLYRMVNDMIKRYWRTWDNMIPNIAAGLSKGVSIGPVTLGHQELLLPNGMKIFYHNLRQEFDPKRGDYNWVYDYGNMKKKLYGAKVVENITQALAGVHIIECGMRILRQTNGQIRFRHQVHDELLFVEDIAHGEQVGIICANEFSTSPWWLPDAPLAAEYGVGASYGEIDK
jgi:DNA polymerase family A